MPFLDSSVVRAGRFTDSRLVGRGAAGLVYYAWDTRLRRPVAVKEVLPGDEHFAATLERFRYEAQIQARLRHPAIIAVYDLIEDSETGEYYLVCEYANAGSLADYLQAPGVVAEEQAIAIALDMCAALEHIWNERIVHCDIKPKNILLAEDGQGVLTARLSDFGIAQDQRASRVTSEPGERHPGTPAYMAPEQWDAANVLDVRTDIYALGMTLFEMLTGQDYKPLLAQAAGSGLQHYAPLVSAGMAQVIQKAVQDDARERYATPQEMADDLRAVLRGAPLPGREVEAASLPAVAPAGRHGRQMRVLGWSLVGVLLVAGMLVALVEWRSAPAFLRTALHRWTDPLVATGVGKLFGSGACAAGPILFVSDRDGDHEVHMINPDGSEQRQLTHNGVEDNLPRWSPDYSQIIFVSYRDGQPDLYVMDGDGGDVRRLTTTTGDDPRWSPDGRHIAFASKGLGDAPNTSWEIYVMGADGSSPRRLTNNNLWDSRPSWSPDGRQIVYTSRRSPSRWELRVVDVAGSDDRVLVGNGYRNNRPVWSPDGKQIAFVSNLAGSWDVYVMGAGGGEPRQLTSDDADETDVAWSPDSQCLAFVGGGTGNNEIYTMDVQGEGLQNLTHSISAERYPAWAP